MDTEWIVDKAKEILLSTGEFPPCIFVEFNQSEQVILGVPQFEMVDGGLDHAKITFLAGRTFARKIQKRKKKCDVTALYLVAEMWRAPATQMNGIYQRARNSPLRKEVLSIATIDVATMKQGLLIYDILRNGSTIDLLKDTERDENVQIVGAGLPCFLAGVKTAKQDQSLAIHEFRRTYEKHAPPIKAAR